MCRFVIFSGINDVRMSDLLIKPSHSIVHQSFNCQERVEGSGAIGGVTVKPSINGDGFGIGWYAPYEELYRPESPRMEQSEAKNIMTVENIRKSNEDQYVAGLKRKLPTPMTESLYHSPTKQAIKKQKILNLGRKPPRDWKHREPAVFVSTTPAWQSRNLSMIAEKIHSPLFFCHVRAASPESSSISEQNCHPFQYGKFLFMHNGMIGDFKKLRRRFLSVLNDDTFALVRGSTDSELCFALFLTKLGIHNAEASAPYLSSKELMRSLVETIREIVSLQASQSSTATTLLNFAVTDGRTVVATRFSSGKSNKDSDCECPGLQSETTLCGPSLYFSSGSEFQLENREFKMRQSTTAQRTVIIASEKLTTAEEDWIHVPQNHVIVVGPRKNVILKPLKV